MDMDDDTPVFTPRDFLKYVASLRNVDLETFQIPPRVIMVYRRRHFNFVNQLLRAHLVNWWWYGDRLSLSIGAINGSEIAAALNFVGSPAAAMVFEELIACGAEKVFEVGTSGGIQPSLQPGDIFVVSEALCDEGTTRQYCEGQRVLPTSPFLKQHLVDILTQNHIEHEEGTVLTTDGVYRETKSKLAKIRRRGVLAINMETSALYAVAKHRGVEIASAQIISDQLTESGWYPAFSDQQVLDNMETLLRLVVTALSKA